MCKAADNFPHVVSALLEDRVATAVVEAIGRISRRSPEKVPNDFKVILGEKSGVWITSRPNLKRLFSLRYKEHQDKVFEIEVSTSIVDYPQRVENLATGIFAMMRRGIVSWQTAHGECATAYGPAPDQKAREERKQAWLANGGLQQRRTTLKTFALY